MEEDESGGGKEKCGWQSGNGAPAACPQSFAAGGDTCLGTMQSAVSVMEGLS